MLSAVVELGANTLAVYQTGSPTLGAAEFSFANGSTTLADKTDTGAFALVLDVSALVEGDRYEVRLYEKGNRFHPKRLVTSWPIEGAQSQPIHLFTAGRGLQLGNGWDLTAVKLAGTDRVVPFTLWVRGPGQAGTPVGTLVWGTAVTSYEALALVVGEATASYEAQLPGGADPSGGLVSIGARRRRRPHWQT